MALIFTLLLGIGNFACHRAVMESGHVMVTDLRPAALRLMRGLSLALEFLLLCAALFAVNSGASYWVWAYVLYSGINGGAAWLIITKRI